MVLASIFGGSFVCIVNKISSNKWNWMRGLGDSSQKHFTGKISSSCALKLCCYLRSKWSVILLKILGLLVFGQQQLIKGQAECNLNQLILEIDLEQSFHSFYFLSIKLTFQISLGYVHFITFFENCMHYITCVQGFCINVTLYEAFKLLITIVPSAEKLHNLENWLELLECATGHKLVVAFNDTHQKGLMSAVLLAVTALHVEPSAFFWTSVMFTILSC